MRLSPSHLILAASGHRQKDNPGADDRPVSSAPDPARRPGQVISTVTANAESIGLFGQS